MRLKVNDLFKAGRLAWELVQQQQGQFYATDWTRTHGTLFQAIKMEKTMMALLLLLIVAVALTGWGAGAQAPSPIQNLLQEQGDVIRKGSRKTVGTAIDERTPQEWSRIACQPSISIDSSPTAATPVALQICV